MEHKQNLHTHTTYCDGKNTPKEIVEAAIKLGFDSIGFSGHSYMHYSPTIGMIPEKEKSYIKEITTLKKEYADRIKIFCGIEYDMYSDIEISGYDYRIGSVHYFYMNGKHIGFDRSADEVENVINTYFDGNGMAYAEKYYEDLSRLPEYGDFEIIGHFDILTKNCEIKSFFDTNSKQYLSYAVEAAESLAGKIPFFEVNTGAISRGYRTTPYPSIPILKELKRLGYGAIITSDCHDAAQLDCSFDESAELLKHCGFKEKYILTENGFIPVSL